jgi:NAD(P)-dependent dehydrogenase (short-subunit alcohol dehydrogenase family)
MASLFNLKGKTALIAGSGGLGRGAAVGLASVGADIVFADIDPTHCAAGTAAVKDYDVKTRELTFDIFDRKLIDKMIDDAIAFNGHLDILVNGVGISRMGHAEELSIDDWMAVQNAFLNNVFYVCQTVAKKAMIPQKYGKIINIASMSGVVVTGNMASPYGAAKAGLVHLTKSLAIEWVKYGIGVNCISPGYMLTPLTEGFLSDPQVSSSILSNIPKGRFGKPEDMAGISVFLASDASDYLVGQNLILDGGYTVI